MQELTHYINGAHVKGTSGRFADVYNPATGEVQATVPLANGAEMDQAVAFAAAAQPAWACCKSTAPRPRVDEVRRSFEPRHGKIG